MKTIEMKGRVSQRHEEQTYRDSKPFSKITLDLEDYQGTMVLNSTKGDQFSDLQVGDDVRVLVLDAAPPKPKKANALGEIEKLVQALEDGGYKASPEELVRKTESWGDKKIEKRHNLGETICASGGIYAPGTK